MRLDLSKISLCFDDFNDERNAVVKLTTLHIDVCQDSTNEESVSLASVLEIDELLLKNSSGSVVFSSADNSASWAVMASSQEKIDFIVLGERLLLVTQLPGPRQLGAERRDQPRLDHGPHALRRLPARAPGRNSSEVCLRMDRASVTHAAIRRLMRLCESNPYVSG